VDRGGGLLLRVVVVLTSHAANFRLLVYYQG
jgi:hypothetical protein